MAVWVSLVEVNHECRNVLLSVFTGDEVVHIHCPQFDVFVAGDMRIVCPLFVVYGLVAECQLPHSLCRAIENDVRVSADAHSGLLQFLVGISDIRILYASLCKDSLDACGDGRFLVNLLHYTPATDFKVQMCPRRIQRSCPFRVPRRRFPNAQVLIALSCTHSLACPDVTDLFLFFRHNS